MLPLLRDLGGRGLAGLPVRHVELHRRRLAARGRDQADRLVGAVEIGVEHDDARAFASVGLADALSDARSAAGHGGDVSLKKPCHCFLPN